MPLDLMQPGGLALALLPEAVLLVGALVLMLVAALGGDGLRTQRRVGFGAMAVQLTALAAAVWQQLQGLTTGPGPIAVDPFRGAVAVVVLLGAFGTTALGIEDQEREGNGIAETHVLTLLAATGMLLLGAARDLMVLFLALEIMSLAAYVLAGINRRDARSAEAALKYFLLGAFSTAFLLLGIAVTYGATGATGLAAIGAAAADPGAARALLHVGVALLLVGFLFKVSAAPFHMWAPDVYDGAPTPVSAFMAATVKTASFAAFLRVWSEAFPAAVDAWRPVLLVIAVLTMVVGSVVALPQANIKRVLAYSSIVHSGYLLIAVLVGTALGRSALVFYLLSYTLATVGAFAVVSVVSRSAAGRTGIQDYAGLWRERPWLAMAMAVYMFALLGFPIVGGTGFLAKWYMLEAALSGPARFPGVAVAVVLTSAISAGFYLYLVQVMFMKPRAEGTVAPAAAGPLTRGVVAVTSFGILLLGLAAAPIVRWADRSAPMVGVPPAPQVSTDIR
jgi:NADH-quinone oxidoreductase subunit N